MPWTGIKLNSGDVMPGLGFGTWKIPPQETVNQISQAIYVGISHLDTAQNYGNERQAGQALKENGLPRSSVWITTKFSGRKSVEESIKDSLDYILLHPYIYAQQKPIIEFCHEEGIAIEAYSPLIPITRVPGGPVDKPLQKISNRTGATYDQILLAWNKAKGSIILSSKLSRLEGYVKAGDIELTAEEIAEIDAAGAKGSDSLFIEDVVPKSNTRTLSLIVLAAVSLTITTAVWVGAHVFNLT